MNVSLLNSFIKKSRRYFKLFYSRYFKLKTDHFLFQTHFYEPLSSSYRLLFYIFSISLPVGFHALFSHFSLFLLPILILSLSLSYISFTTGLPLNRVFNIAPSQFQFSNYLRSRLKFICSQCSSSCFD